MTDPALLRRIEMTASSTIVLGAVCLILAALQAVGPLLLRRLGDVLDAEDDPTRAMRDAWSAGAGTGALVNALFGVALVAIGIAVWRRRRWAHGALTAACWASIVVLVILAKPTLEPFFALGGGHASGWALILVGAVLLVAQLAAVLVFLRFWLRPEVRGAFR